MMIAQDNRLSRFCLLPFLRNKRQTVRWLGLATMTLFATGSWGFAIAQAGIAQAEPDDRLLLAQQVIDGLPPPPPLIFDQRSLPPVQPAQPVQPYQSAPPANAIPVQTEPQQRYLVYVNGDSPLLLAQVRKVESGAFLQTYEGRQVIQAGLFEQAAIAEQQVAALESEGIGAEVARIESDETDRVAAVPQTVNTAASSTSSSSGSLEYVPVAQAPREVEFGQSPQFNSVEVAQSFGSVTIPDDSYYVVIPERSRNVEAVSNQVRRLGGGLGVGQVTYERESPLGPHVIVGPFINRGTAADWSRYFRDFGLDARVYYRR
jgi:hypothetical protein